MHHISVRRESYFLEPGVGKEARPLDRRLRWVDHLDLL